MLTNSCAQRRTTSATTLDFPTPEGPETTVSRGPAASLAPASHTSTARVDHWRARSSGPIDSGCLFWTELAEQGLALALAEPAQPPAGGDLQPLHDLLSADLAHAWQGLEQRRDLHL